MPHFLETLYEAQKIAFAPFLFKAVSAALQTEFLPGIVHQKSPKTPHEWAETLGLTPYAVDVMADILVSARVLARRDAERTGRSNPPAWETSSSSTR